MCDTCYHRLMAGRQPFKLVTGDRYPVVVLERVLTDTEYSSSGRTSTDTRLRSRASRPTSSHSLTVRTSGSQPGSRGSTPRESTLSTVVEARPVSLDGQDLASNGAESKRAGNSSHSVLPLVKPYVGECLLSWW